MERLAADAFEGDHLRRPGTWAVAFLADWCPFCRAFAPKFDALAGGGSFHVARGDVTDEASPLWDVFHLEVVPTVVVFRDGVPGFRRDGQLGRGLSDTDLAAIRAELTGH
jgi:thiol-disulfide isomerase/thioredoxin